MRLSIKMKQRKNVPAKLVGTILLLSCLLTIQGCGDRYDQVDCSNSLTVMHTSGEFCMCAEGYGWMYDYEIESWRCIGLFTNRQTDNLYSYGFTSNGNQFGNYNSLYYLRLNYNKSDSTFNKVSIDNHGPQTPSGVYIKNDLEGDSLYMKDLRLRTTFNSIDFDFEGKRCFVAGRGRVSLNKDTLDMTAYIIPWDDYALVASANGVYRDDRDIDVSKAADVRKMQFLSARAFPKYAQ